MATPPPLAPRLAAPDRVLVPEVRIDSPVDAVGTDAEGAMQLPPDPARAGWYRWSARPGATVGTTVIAAHVDSFRYGVGPFAGLRNVPVGAPVTVRRADSVAVTYRVESVKYVERETLPIRDLFRADGAPRLVMLTCGGPYDAGAGGYQDNVVLTARPVGAAG